MQIFLLEDDFNLNEAIKESLELYNFSIDSFYDGNVAYEHIGNIYDIYILDINVPNISGLELLSSIKKINPNTKVLIISANIDMESIRKAYNLNCDDYLKKPFDIEELILKIKKYLPQKKELKLMDNVFYDLDTKEIAVNNIILKLTKNEKTLFYLLILNRGNKITYSQIEDYVYEGESSSTDAIRSLIKRLRKKIPENIILNSLDEGYFIK